MGGIKKTQSLSPGPVLVVLDKVVEYLPEIWNELYILSGKLT